MNPTQATIYILLLLYSVQALYAAGQAGFSSLPAAEPGFDELIAEGGMRFQLPAGFREPDRRPNRLFPYDKAVRSEDGSLEVRYAVRPLARIRIDYEDPHSSTPDPNHMFPLMFQSLVSMLSGGGHSPTREFPKDQAGQRFNAHWAAAAVFDVSPDFNTDHKQALVIALHKNHLADAYSIFLFDDYDLVKGQIDGNLSSLAFLPE